jgi:hypothetical protein
VVLLAKGWNAIEEQTEATAAARERNELNKLPDLRVGAKRPGPYIVRFLEQGQEVNNYPVHEYKVPDGAGGFYNRKFTCLTEAGVPSNQCPGCAAGLKRKSRGVYNLIERNRPILRKGQDGKALKNPDGSWMIDGYVDTVVIANVGGPTAEMLRKTDGSMGGLMSRDWHVVYSGDTFQSWFMTPVADAAGNSMATPMSEADFALAAAKHDLDKYMAPPSMQEAAQIVAKYGANSGAQPQQAPQQQAPPANQFLTGVDPNALAVAQAQMAQAGQSTTPPAA